MELISSLVFGVWLASVPVQGVSAQAATWTGTWERNAAESDDPKEKMQEAMEQMGEPGRPGQGHFGGGGGRPPGREGGPRKGGMPGDPAGRASQGRPDFARVADELVIELDAGELTIDDGERLQIYYLDGQKHIREMSNGTKLETVAEHKGNAVLITEKMERGELDRKLELSPDGDTLISTLSVKLGRMKDPVVIRTVYEKAETITSSD